MKFKQIEKIGFELYKANDKFFKTAYDAKQYAKNPSLPLLQITETFEKFSPYQAYSKPVYVIKTAKNLVRYVYREVRHASNSYGVENYGNAQFCTDQALNILRNYNDQKKDYDGCNYNYKLHSLLMNTRFKTRTEHIKTRLINYRFKKRRLSKVS